MPGACKLRTIPSIHAMPTDLRRRHCLSLIRSAALLGAAPWLSACLPEQPVTVGIHPWIGYETLYLAREFGWLPEDIRFQEGKTASDSLAALKAGIVDAACLTLDETLRARSYGLPLAVALVFDVSVGADKLLARPELRRLADLAGRRLGFERNAVGALVLDRLLAEAGLAADALTLIDLPVDRQLAAWREGRLDALITYEPTASLVQREGARPLFDSRRMPDAIFDVLAVRLDRAGRRGAALSALLANHFRVLSHLRTHQGDALYRIAGHQGLTPGEARLVLSGVALPSLEANRSYLSTADTRIAQAARTLSALMVRNGLLDQQDALQDLIVPDWLPGEE
jgi:NitT/TauT family transport system substrate-binding protein